MKIGLLSFEYPPGTGFGGIGTYTYNHAKALHALGHDVHVLAGWTEPRDTGCSVEDGITVWRGQRRVAPAVLGRVMDRFRLHWSKNRLETALSMLALVRAAHRQHRLDVIEMPECGAEGMLVNHMLGIPSVVRFHSPARLIMEHYDTPRADRTLCPVLERIGMAGATAFTSCSEFLADEVRRKVGRPGWPIDTIHNGIDLAAFDRAPSAASGLRARFGIAPATPVVLFSGRLEPRKGVHLLAPVLRQVLAATDAVALIAGSDHFGIGQAEVLPALAADGLASRVFLTGRLSAAEVRAALAEADVFFMPSQWEACPYACLEAMAAGKPIVAASAGGLPELLTHGQDGLLAAPQDVAGFVQAITGLLADPARAAALGRAARHTVEQRFDHVVTARRIMDVYRRITPA